MPALPPQLRGGDCRAAPRADRGQVQGQRGSSRAGLRPIGWPSNPATFGGTVWRRSYFVEAS
eukprot:2538823-Alexandrium_andersonii.AAC.1